MHRKSLFEKTGFKKRYDTDSFYRAKKSILDHDRATHAAVGRSSALVGGLPLCFNRGNPRNASR